MPQPHAPHRSPTPSGAYIVTASTYRKARFLDTPEKLDLHTEMLFDLAEEYKWQLQAWAVFANHYHFVGLASEDNLNEFLGKLHNCSSREVNKLDQVRDRKVWCRHWDTALTYERSYLARLQYVHSNAVKHQLVAGPREYRWCSANWFFLRADRPFYETVSGFRTDTVNVIDDFD